MSEPRRPTPWEILAFTRSGKPAAEAPPAVAEALDERFRRFVENGQAAQSAIDALGAGASSPPSSAAADVAADDAAFGPWRRCLGGDALDCQAWARGDRGCPKHRSERPAVQGAPGAQRGGDRTEPTTPARPAALPRVAGRAGLSSAAKIPPAPRTVKRRGGTVSQR